MKTLLLILAIVAIGCHDLGADVAPQPKWHSPARFQAGWKINTLSVRVYERADSMRVQLNNQPRLYVSADKITTGDGDVFRFRMDEGVLSSLTELSLSVEIK